MRNTNGYIKLHRKIKDWDWYDDPATLSVWIHLLLSANYEDGEWKGVAIPRGALITSISNLSLECGLSVKQIRTCIERLKKGKQIDTKGASKWTIITVCNFDSYQLSDSTEGRADGEQVDNKKATDNKNTRIKKENKEKKLQEKEIVEHLYSLYPATTYRGDRGVTSTGKCGKDKIRIAYLLRTHTAEQIERSITKYIEENPRGFLKNFSTFLNNMPEYEDETVHSPAEEDEYAHYE